MEEIHARRFEFLQNSFGIAPGYVGRTAEAKVFAGKCETGRRGDREMGRWGDGEQPVALCVVGALSTGRRAVSAPPQMVPKQVGEESFLLAVFCGSAALRCGKATPFRAVPTFIAGLGLACEKAQPSRKTR